MDQKLKYETGKLLQTVTKCIALGTPARTPGNETG
jgi:hypothetical protein